jgi:hypothetical protein
MLLYCTLAVVDRFSRSIHRPPVIEKPAIKVALWGRALAVSDAATRFSLHPLLAVAVLGVLDILAGMEERLAVKPPVDISGARDVVTAHDHHQPVVLTKTHLASITGAGSACGGWRKQLIPLLLEPQQGFVYLCFCHIPFRSEQSVSPGKDRSNCRAAWRGIPFAHACSAFAEEPSSPCEHFLSFVLWVSIFSMKS